MRTVKYACIRYFLQKNLLADFGPDAPAPNVFFMIEALKNRQIKVNESTYAIRIVDSKEHIYYGKLSKRSLMENYDLTPVDVVENQIENWPYVEFLCDPLKNQVIVIRLKSGFLDTAIRAKNILGQIFSEIMTSTGYGISFEPLVKPSSFWNMINSCDKVYSVRLHMLSPNLFGANSKANEMLKELAQNVNNTETDIKILNKRGDLKIKEENLGSHITYVEQGGGFWTARIQDEQGTRSVNSGTHSAEYSVQASIEEDSKRLDEAYGQAKEDIILP